MGFGVGQRTPLEDALNESDFEKLCNGSGGSGIEVSMELMSERDETTEQAFAEFYRREQPGAMRLVWLLTHSADVCDDIVQDAFTAVYRRFASLEKPGAYLRTTLVNGVRQRSRSTTREQRRLRISSKHLARALERVGA
jgi:DNA-directed RNA polymerase specialized sigma24 family protein